LDAQQNLDVVHLDVVHLDAMHPVGVVVDVELLHQLKMDCYLDVVDEEVRHLLKMDYYLAVVQLVHQELVVLQMLQAMHLHEQSLLELLLEQLQHLPLLLHAKPSTLQDRHRALLQVLLQALD
jgi:rRNA-processing protein FCF1